jgi:phosphoglycolate phosphatase-like HAD superfamily hydrolase
MIILFDVDGVLVENRAYRAGIQQTTRYFSQRLGLDSQEPSDADIDVFEAESITVEWDSCAIVAAALLLERLQAEARTAAGRARLRALPRDVWQFLAAVPGRTPKKSQVDFAALARRVGAATRANGLLPARAALRLFLDDLRQQDHVPVEFAQPLLENLLGQVYEIDHSPAMQVFQNYVLGDEQYAEHYGLTPLVKGAALLELDRPLLRPEVRQAVLARRADGDWFPVVFTARPSRPPLEAGSFGRGYTPEGEMGAGLVGLESVPVIGFGKLDWLARRFGQAGWELVKPSPVHLMAAIGAARTGLEVESIKAALAVERGDHLRYPLTACAGQDVHVFEDSPSSLRGVAQAVQHLNRAGLGLQLTMHGVAPAGSPKRATLTEVADFVHDDVNQGVQMILGL